MSPREKYRAAPKRKRASPSGGAPAQERELRAQGRKTMRRLLDASIVVFDRRGYHAARVDDIVKGARTSHGTFYLYFANKEDLFKALVTDVAQEMASVSDSLGRLGPGPAGFDELRRWLARFSEVYWRNGPVLRAWNEAATDDGEFGELGVKVTSAFSRALIKRVREASPTTGIDPTVATLALVAMIERLHYYILIDNIPIDREALIDTLAIIAHQGLFGSSSGGRRSSA